MLFFLFSIYHTILIYRKVPIDERIWQNVREHDQKHTHIKQQTRV